MKKIHHSLTLAVVLALSLSFLPAQRPGQDPVEHHLVSPELIMKHQGTLGLDDEQRRYIIGEVSAAQPQITALHWDVQREMESLADHIQRGDPEEMILEQLDRVLDIEREIKRLHLTLAVRIRGRLSQEQLRTLQGLKEKRQREQPH